MSLIRASALSHFPELVRELGGDPGELLAAHGIRAADAGRSDVYVGLRGGISAIEAAATATGTMDFGRRLGLRQGIEILGPLGVAARTAETLGAALRIFDLFMAAYSPGLSVRLHPHADPTLMFFEYRVELEPAPPQEQTVELSLGITLRVLQFLLGPDYRPVSAHIPHPPVGPAADYRHYFGCPVRFGEPAAGFSIRGADLDRPLRRDHLMHQTAMDYLDSIVEQRPQTAARAVSDITRHLLPTGTATIDNVATQMGLHPKALQRKLSAEQTTFAEILDRVRRDTAQRCLRNPDITLAHLTRQLGYAEQSVLTRACQRWFGTTPTLYRATLLAASG